MPLTGGKPNCWRIGVTGRLNGRFVEPLVDSICQTRPETHFGVWGYEDADTLSSDFLATLQGPNVFLNSETSAGEANRRSLSFLASGKVQSRMHATVRIAKERIRRRQFKNWCDGFDIIHLQSLFDSRPIRHLTRTKLATPLVVSLWGSDILRQANPRIVRRQRELLQMATLITASGEGFANEVKSKFGNTIAGKIRDAYFSPGIETMRAIWSSSEESIKLFREQSLRANAADCLVCIGHNAAPENQHLCLISSLRGLAEKTKQRLLFIFPLTYGGDARYIDAIRLASNEAGLRSVFLTDYLSNSEVGLLRLATDILVFTPTTDAFSATVTQCLAAGSRVITGQWLKYQERARQGFHYWTVESPTAIEQSLGDLIDPLETQLDSLRRNREIAKQLFSAAGIAGGWIKVYEEARSEFCATLAHRDMGSSISSP